MSDTSSIEREQGRPLPAILECGPEEPSQAHHDFERPLSAICDVTIRELNEALEEFAITDDIERPKIKIFHNKGDVEYRASFLRNPNFSPSGKNRISTALFDLEAGDRGPIEQIDEELEHLGIIMRFRSRMKKTYKPGGEIYELVLVHRGNIHEILFEKSA